VLATAHPILSVLAVVIGIVALVLYFVPTGVGLARRHHWMLRIFLVNLLLGWTVIGWVVAFHMACTSRVATKALWRRTDAQGIGQTVSYIPTEVPLPTTTAEQTGGIDQNPNP
jgi:hypothetical protein